MRRRIGDEDVESIIEGGTHRDPAFDALGEIVAELGRSDAVAPETAAAHIAAAASLALEPAVTAAVEPSVSWRRRLIVRGAQLGLTAKILLGTAVAVAATGGAAATGILPDAVQGAIADTASYVGIDLPNPRLETTTTTEPDDDHDDDQETVVTGSTTTTTTEPDDDSDEEDESVVTEGLVAGVYTWATTSCTGAPVSVEYTVTEDGRLTVGMIVGAVDDIDTGDDRIRVRYEDGIRVDIRIHDDRLTIDEDRDCDESDEDSTTTTTTDDHDDPNEPDDDSDDPEDPDDD